MHCLFKLNDLFLSIILNQWLHIHSACPNTVYHRLDSRTPYVTPLSSQYARVLPPFFFGSVNQVFLTHFDSSYLKILDQLPSRVQVPFYGD